jgi:hypothetical protein
LLHQYSNAGVRVYSIWQPMLATDLGAPGARTLARLSDSRVQQYWDPERLVARRLAADARPPQPVQECCERSGVLWDLAAVYETGTTWEDRLPTAVFFNGPVVDVAHEIGALLTPASPAAGLVRPAARLMVPGSPAALSR